MERPNGRRRDQLRALLTRSPQENISGADPGNHNDPLATEQEEQARQEERNKGTETVAALQVWYRLYGCHTESCKSPVPLLQSNYFKLKLGLTVYIMTYDLLYLLYLLYLPLYIFINSSFCLLY